MDEVLRHLGAVSMETGEHAMRSVDQRWDSSQRLPSANLVIRRNMDIGQALLPWQVPSRLESEELRAGLERECTDSGEPQALPLHDRLGSVIFRDWLTFAGLTSL